MPTGSGSQMLVFRAKTDGPERAMCISTTPFRSALVSFEHYLKYKKAEEGIESVGHIK
jgi:hypothetical protein